MADLVKVTAELSKIFKAKGYNPYDHVPDNPLSPAAIIGVPTTIELADDMATLKGFHHVTWPVRLEVSKASAREAQQALYKAVSTGNAESVIDALRNADRSHGAWRSLIVQRVWRWEWSGDLFACEIVLDIVC